MTCLNPTWFRKTFRQSSFMVFRQSFLWLNWLALVFHARPTSLENIQLELNFSRDEPASCTRRGFSGLSFVLTNWHSDSYKEKVHFYLNHCSDHVFIEFIWDAVHLKGIRALVLVSLPTTAPQLNRPSRDKLKSRS